jgi:hypothetical protein
MPVSCKSKKNISKKIKNRKRTNKTRKHIRKMKGGGERFKIINDPFNKMYRYVDDNDINKTFLKEFQLYDPIVSDDEEIYNNAKIAFQTSGRQPAKKIRIFDNFSRLLGEVKKDDLKMLSSKININTYISLDPPLEYSLCLSTNNIKQLMFEITYDATSSF